MNNHKDIITKEQLKKDLPALKPGDTVRVHQRIKEGDKERVQVFEGTIIALKHGQGVSGTFTVRRITDGLGVERIFPLHAPFIEKIELVSHGQVRRAKLYYLRNRVGKRAKVRRKETKPRKTEKSPVQ